MCVCVCVCDFGVCVCVCVCNLCVCVCLCHGVCLDVLVCVFVRVQDLRLGTWVHEMMADGLLRIEIPLCLMRPCSKSFCKGSSCKCGQRAFCMFKSSLTRETWMQEEQKGTVKRCKEKRDFKGFPIVSERQDLVVTK